VTVVVVVVGASVVVVVVVMVVVVVVVVVVGDSVVVVVVVGDSVVVVVVVVVVVHGVNWQIPSHTYETATFKVTEQFGYCEDNWTDALLARFQASFSSKLQKTGSAIELQPN
jgi:hypothetical protein